MEGSSATGGGFHSWMALNDNKAGMEGLDRDRINKIIMEASKGSRFYENEAKKEQQVNQRIEKMMLQKAKITEQQLQKAQTQVERTMCEMDTGRDLSRVIVHVDMDAFYAAVEMRDCPELKDKPMAVGSMSMLSTSNYHARKFGVRAAMPGFIAKKLCPALVIVPTNFDRYRAASKEIREIFAEYDPHYQPMSLDEAYLDFTEHLEQRISWPESLRTHRLRAHTAAETGDLESKVPQEPEPCVENLSPLLFEDSPCTPPSLPASGGSAVPGGGSEVPGGGAEVPGGGSEVLGGGAEVPGGGAEVPGGGSEVPGGGSEVPGGDAEVPGGDSEVFGTCAEEAVREMRFRIEQKTMLTASAGIAPNTMLAKVCSDRNKPNGQYLLPPDREAVVAFIQSLPVRKVFGIGKVSEKMLGSLGITSCAHLGQQMALLSLLFSETACHHFMSISLGLGSTHMERDGERKSKSTERTFREMSVVEEQLSLCRELCEDLAGELKAEGLRGKTVTLKLKNVAFEVKTRACTLPCAVATADEIYAVTKDLLRTEIDSVSPQRLKLRLMGVRISAFVSADDKKPQQKSIVGFLQQGTSGPSQAIAPSSAKESVSHRSTETETPAARSHPLAFEQSPRKVPGLPVWAAGRTESQRQQVDAVAVEKPKPPQSFFQRAYAKKLQLLQQVQSSGAGADKGQLSVCSGFDQRGTDHESEHESVLGSSTHLSVTTNAADVGVAPQREEACSASASACATYESLTCPVCFAEVRTTDLDVFNRHIDRCLSGVAANKPHGPADTDSEMSDGQRDGRLEGSPAKDEWIEEEEEEEEGEEDKERQKKSKPEPDDDLDDFKICETRHRSRVSRREDEPRVHTSQEASSSTSHLESHPPSHEGSAALLVCPVCQVPQNTNDLALLNRHVDLCLNQEVLHKLGEGASSSKLLSPASSSVQRPITAKKSKGDERDRHMARPGKGKSKRRGPPTSPPAKKAKGQLRSQNTIDRFFR